MKKNKDPKEYLEVDIFDAVQDFFGSISKKTESELENFCDLIGEILFIALNYKTDCLDELLSLRVSSICLKDLIGIKSNPAYAKVEERERGVFVSMKP